jgi:hypothetical protein
LDQLVAADGVKIISDKLLFEDLRNSDLAEVGGDTVEVLVEGLGVELVVQLGSVLSFNLFL